MEKLDKIKFLKQIHKIMISTIAILLLGTFCIVTTILLVNKISNKDGDTLQALLPIYSMLLGASITGIIAIGLNQKPKKDKDI